MAAPAADPAPLAATERIWIMSAGCQRGTRSGSMQVEPIISIGAGLTAAYELVKHGARPVVLSLTGC